MKRVDENELRDKPRLYLQHSDGKNVLRRAMASYIPERILKRKKQGFSAPDESWYRGQNAHYIKELLLNKQPAVEEFIRPEYVHRIVHEHIEQQVNHRLLIWSFLNFEWWCRLFLRGDRLPEH
jgi:asparagine synthase (glutamine-hydrolysing)